MADLIYSAITSLEGYVADQRGNFDWAAPDGVELELTDERRFAGGVVFVCYRTGT
jgi:hypothetical protein